MTNENAINILRHLSPPRTSKAAFDAFKQAIEMAIEALEQPEIVYCRYCKHADSVKMGTWCCKGGGGLVSPDFFCGHGKRGEERETD